MTDDQQQLGRWVAFLSLVISVPKHTDTQKNCENTYFYACMYIEWVERDVYNHEKQE